MNHYPKHVGDYLKDTVGLSMLEDGAYNRLLDQVYVSESALPLDKDELYRLARATSPAERKAVDYVVKKFFEQRETGFHQKRADDEISAYQERAQVARDNGRLGGRKRNRTAKQNETQSEPTGLFLGNPEGTQRETSRKPVTNTESKDSGGEPPISDEIWAKGPVFLESKGVLPKNARSFIGKMRKQHGDEAVAAALHNAILANVIEPIPYLVKSLDDSPRASSKQWLFDENAAMAEGRKYGLEPGRGEGWPEFRGRISTAKANDARGVA